MSQNKNLVQIAPGVSANKSDPMLGYKKLRYGYVPTSPLEEAKMLEDAANATADPFIRRKLNQQIKEIYLSMLDYKQSLYIHEKLANVLTHAEALEMANRYTHPEIKEIYASRADDVHSKRRKVKEWPSGAPYFGRIAAWVIPLLMLLGVVVVLLHHIFIFRRTTTIVSNTVNHATYIPRLGDPCPTGTVPIPSNDSPEQIADQVDSAGIPSGATYAILSLTGQVIGAATNTGEGHYQIQLLRKANLPTSLSAEQLNFIRTAYNFYVQTHGTPPNSLSQMKNLLPNPQDLSAVKFVPVSDPALAIQPLSGKVIPFAEPEIFVDLQRHEMQLVYQGRTLLKTSIGIGEPSQPTPVGRFQITGRIVETSHSVYGPYVFPLNFSQFALHGTNDPGKIGKQESIGCVEVPNNVDARLFSMVPVGTPVYIEQRVQTLEMSAPENPRNFR